MIRFPGSALKSGFPWVAVALLLPVSGLADDAPEKEEATFLPEVEKKFAEVMGKAAEEKSKDESARFKKEMAIMVKVTGLDEAGQNALDKWEAEAVERSMKDWRGKVETFYRTNSGGNLSVETLEQMLTEIAGIVRSPYGADYVKSWDQSVFQEALAKTLDAKQAETWKKDVDERRRKFDEETKGVLAATKARYREVDAQAISGTVSAIAQTVPLDEERTKKLQKLGEQAADKSSETTKEKARRTLLAYGDSDRKQSIKFNRLLYIAPDEKDGPEMQTVWNDGLKEILTPEESQRWETALTLRAERRTAKLAQMLVWALDQAIAFTAAQREQIRPIAEKCVREKTALFAENRGSSYTSYSVETFYLAAVAAKDADLQKILDGKQLARWKALSSKKTTAQRLAMIRARGAAASKERAKLAPFEPEDLEHAISDQLAEMADREKETALANFLLQADDAIRVAGVEGKAAQRLQTAARGAMEADFASWCESWATNIRAQLQGATPADFQQRLQNIGLNSVYRRRPSTSAGKDGIWEKTVVAELTEAQRAAWKKETDARDADEQRTVFVTILGEIDRTCLLTEEQRGKFEPLLTAHLQEYDPELRGMFPQGNNGWFLMGYYMLTPVAGIPEKELRTILSDAQWKALSGSQQFSNGAQYWDNIEQNHKRRVKEKEKEKEKK